MKGWIYRRAAAISSFGERVRPRYIGALIRSIGLALRDWILDHATVGDLQRNLRSSITAKRTGCN